MASCLVESMGPASGKSTICAGLGKKLLDRGVKVGYFKPLLPAVEETGAVTDEDCEYLKQVFRMEEPAEALCPALPSMQALGAVQAGGASAVRSKLGPVHATFVKLAKGREAMVVEGFGDIAPDKPRAVLSQALADSLDAKVLLVARYGPGLTGAQVAATAKLFGARLLGVVLNAVPTARSASVQSTLLPAIKQAGIDVLGVIPESRALFAISVADIADHLEGQVLNNPERAGALVENIMVGALGLDPALAYFGRKGSKAVVARGNRADIQLAALETPTSCLVLTGGSKPIQNIQFRAQEKGVPMIAVKDDTLTALGKLEQAFSGARFRQDEKLQVLDDLLTQNFDLKAFSDKVGLKL